MGMAPLWWRKSETKGMGHHVPLLPLMYAVRPDALRRWCWPFGVAHRVASSPLVVKRRRWWPARGSRLVGANGGGWPTGTAMDASEEGSAGEVFSGARLTGQGKDALEVFARDAVLVPGCALLPSRPQEIAGITEVYRSFGIPASLTHMDCVAVDAFPNCEW